MKRQQTCPCDSGKSYTECCGVLHRGDATANTAEALMRSRYSAYAVGDEGYLLRTWHSTTRPQRVDFDPALRWTGLEILGTTGGSPFHTAGTVEFNASYRQNGRAEVMHENSGFAREDGRWVYVEAAV
ncbi:YchJ family protein [Actinosynnema sp. ALI-1.44]|uniref:YchJ family protein n=1 Tax=Actinosynnema sp. ALI-1.44 TaxID=1933779 RepID=UPI001EDA1657|nr:YchJ family metal-binding protein [Actinosynnema sp. ALI-1.44]